MSSNQEFFIKIPNDIIGKAWLATLDDSGGYVLSLKPIEQNSLSPVLPTQQQEEQHAVPETNSQNITFPENSQEQKASRFLRQKELLDDFKKYFKKYPQKLPSFVAFMKERGIKNVKYGELSAVNSRNDKIRNIIDSFSEDLKELRRLQELLKEFKDSN